MTDDGRCTGCGSKLPAEDGACPYCGTAATSPVAVTATPDPAAVREAALAAVRAHPSFDALARDVPETPAIVKAMFAVPIVVGVGFIVLPLIIGTVGGWIALELSGKAWIALVAAGVPLLFAIPGVIAIVAGLSARKRIFAGAVRASPAVVLAKRTEPGAKATAYYVTLGFEGGERHEYGTFDPVFRSAFEGDAGVAHCRGELLLGFRKVDV